MLVNDWLNFTWPALRTGYEDADETGLFYKRVPTRTLEFKGETSSGGKLSKERLNILLCTSSLGEKRKPLVIGKSRSPRCFKNQNTSVFNYSSNRKAWMLSCIFKAD